MQDGLSLEREEARTMVVPYMSIAAGVARNGFSALGTKRQFDCGSSSGISCGLSAEIAIAKRGKGLKAVVRAPLSDRRRCGAVQRGRSQGREIAGLGRGALAGDGVPEGGQGVVDQLIDARMECFVHTIGGTG